MSVVWLNGFDCHNFSGILKLKDQRCCVIFRAGSDCARRVPSHAVSHTTRGAADAMMTNEYWKENLTGRSKVVLAAMADDSALT
jgi:hypothetical protein